MADRSVSVLMTLSDPNSGSKVVREDVTCVLFADDVKLYTVLKANADIINLQEALDSIGHWSAKWQMPISIKKCILTSRIYRDNVTIEH